MEQTKFSLNAGELTDELAGRIDLSKVQMGLSVAENVRVLRVGGVTRRAGTEYIQAVEDETKKSRLEGFRFAENQGVCIEFSHLKMNIIKDGVQIAGAYTTPWTEAQVFAIQFAQRIDGIIAVHPDVPPQFITRISNSNWTITEFPWQERVWELATDSVISLTPAAKTGTTTISASANIFTSAWVGTRLRLAHVRPEQPIKKTIGDVATGAVASALSTTSHTAGTIIKRTGDAYTRPIGKYAGVTPVGDDAFWTVIADYDHTTDFTGSFDPDAYPAFFLCGIIAIPAQDVSGKWSFETFGTFVATYVVERSYNGGAWNPVKVAASDDDKNFLVQDTEEVGANAKFRVLLLDADTDVGNLAQRFAFTIDAFKVYGNAVITGYTSPTLVSVTVGVAFNSTEATTEWYEDAFNPKNGYPKTCTFHQTRLFFGGSLARPQSIWASKVRQPFNFTIGTLADDGLSFETEAREYESVLWLSSHLALLVGTTSGIWSISSPNGLSITAENNAITKQVRIGAFEGIPAVALQNNIIYLQSKGRKLHELTGGSVEYGGYTDVDLTQLASHITRGGVTQIATGEVPDSSIYMVSGNEIALLTYERAQNVVGWSRWKTLGDFESVGICPGSGEDDDVYFVVKRGSRRFIERLTPDMLRVEEDNDMENLVFVDCSFRKTNATAFTTITGLSHLEGGNVTVFADGEKQGDFLVGSGTVTLPHAVNNAVVGYGYDSIVTTMPLDQGTVGRKSAILAGYVRFRNSLGMKMKQDNGQFSKVNMPLPRIVNNEPLPLLSGDAEATLHSSWARSPAITVKQSDPLPMTILAIRFTSKTSP
jgi:hypothetical protein